MSSFDERYSKALKSKARAEQLFEEGYYDETLTHCRRFITFVTERLCKDNNIECPENVSDRLGLIKAQHLFEKDEIDQMYSINEYGNDGSHPELDTDVTREDASEALEVLKKLAPRLRELDVHSNISNINETENKPILPNRYMTSNIRGKWANVHTSSGLEMQEDYRTQVEKATKNDDVDAMRLLALGFMPKLSDNVNWHNRLLCMPKVYTSEEIDQENAFDTRYYYWILAAAATANEKDKTCEYYDKQYIATTLYQAILYLLNEYRCQKYFQKVGQRRIDPRTEARTIYFDKERKKLAKPFKNDTVNQTLLDVIIDRNGDESTIYEKCTGYAKEYAGLLKKLMKESDEASEKIINEFFCTSITNESIDELFKNAEQIHREKIEEDQRQEICRKEEEARREAQRKEAEAQREAQRKEAKAQREAQCKEAEAQRKEAEAQALRESEERRQQTAKNRKTIVIAIACLIVVSLVWRGITSAFSKERPLSLAHGNYCGEFTDEYGQDTQIFYLIVDGESATMTCYDKNSGEVYEEVGHFSKSGFNKAFKCYSYDFDLKVSDNKLFLSSDAGDATLYVSTGRQQISTAFIGDYLEADQSYHALASLKPDGENILLHISNYPHENVVDDENYQLVEIDTQNSIYLICEGEFCYKADLSNNGLTLSNDNVVLKLFESGSSEAKKYEENSRELGSQTALTSLPYSNNDNLCVISADSPNVVSLTGNTTASSGIFMSDGSGSIEYQLNGKYNTLTFKLELMDNCADVGLIPHFFADGKDVTDTITSPSGYYSLKVIDVQTLRIDLASEYGGVFGDSGYALVDLTLE